MTRVATAPALARLKAQFPRPEPTRVLVHRGTCGDAAGAASVVSAFQVTFGARSAESACDGACWAAPAATVQRDGHQHRFPRLDLVDGHIPEELSRCFAGECDDEYAGRGQYGLLERTGRTDGSFADLVARGGYAALAHAATLDPSRIVEAIERVGTTGRGSVHRITAEGWSLVSRKSNRHHLVVDADQDTPRLIRDRHLIEGDPHQLIEGILITCHAVGIDEAVVNISDQAPYARAAFETALTQAQEHGVLDGSSLGNRPVAIEVRGGANAGGQPAMMSDVETLCAVTTVFDTPPPPTKLIVLSGSVPRPGLYEVPVDGNTNWAGVIAMAGAAPGLVPAVLLDGPSGRVVLPEAYETPLTVDGLDTGGAVVLPRDTDITADIDSVASDEQRES